MDILLPFFILLLQVCLTASGKPFTKIPGQRTLDHNEENMHNLQLKKEVDKSVGKTSHRPYTVTNNGNLDLAATGQPSVTIPMEPTVTNTGQPSVTIPMESTVPNTVQHSVTIPMEPTVTNTGQPAMTATKTPTEILTVTEPRNHPAGDSDKPSTTESAKYVTANPGQSDIVLTGTSAVTGTETSVVTDAGKSVFTEAGDSDITGTESSTVTDTLSSIVMDTENNVTTTSPKPTVTVSIEPKMDESEETSDGILDRIDERLDTLLKNVEVLKGRGISCNVTIDIAQTRNSTGDRIRARESSQGRRVILLAPDGKPVRSVGSDDIIGELREYFDSCIAKGLDKRSCIGQVKSMINSIIEDDIKDPNQDAQGGFRQSHETRNLPERHESSDGAGSIQESPGNGELKDPASQMLSVTMKLRENGTANDKINSTTYQDGDELSGFQDRVEEKLDKIWEALEEVRGLRVACNVSISIAALQDATDQINKRDGESAISELLDLPQMVKRRRSKHVNKQHEHVKHGTRVQKAKTKPELRVRKEYRAMDESERRRFHEALRKAFENGTVAAYGKIHSHTSYTAHRGAAFLPWHRVFITKFEDDLRQFDDTVALPYWDCTFDRAMKKPGDSVLWSDQYFGNMAGDVVTGFAKGWTSAYGNLHRTCGQVAMLPSKENFDNLLKHCYLKDVSFPGGGFETYEQFHNDVHAWVGGDMSAVGTAAFDPIFYLMHAFFDYKWEQFRQHQAAECRVDPATDYPNIKDYGLHVPNVTLLGRRRRSSHKADDLMDGMPDFKNIDGISDHWTTEVFTYEPSPSCENNCANSDLLYCDTTINYCVSKARHLTKDARVDVAAETTGLDPDRDTPHKPVPENMIQIGTRSEDSGRNMREDLYPISPRYRKIIT